MPRIHTSLASISLFVSLAACTADASNPTPSAQDPAAPPPVATDPSATPPVATTPDPTAPPPAPQKTLDEGAIFTIDNAADANAVRAWKRNDDGSLTDAGVHPTGGRGTGKGLGSQGALALSASHDVLVVVDPGSDTITSFSVSGAALDFRSRVSAGGTMPVSVAIHGNLVYVLDAGSSAISGFQLDAQGHLSPIASSTRALSTATAGGAEIAFSPKGDVLVVTEKATNVISTFALNADGTAQPGVANKSSGQTPFGFAISPAGTVVVSEAFGAAAGAGAVSSYVIGSTKDVDLVSASIPNHQTAPCWVAISGDGKLAISSNTPSGTLSSFGIAADGSLALVGSGSSASTGDGSKPVDLVFDRSSKRVYVLASGAHAIDTLDVSADGSLALRTAPIAVPDTAAGIAGY